MAKMIAENGTGGKKNKGNQSKTKRYTEKEFVLVGNLGPRDIFRTVSSL